MNFPIAALRGKGSQSSVGKGKRGNSGDRRGSVSSIDIEEGIKDYNPQYFVFGENILINLANIIYM